MKGGPFGRYRLQELLGHGGMGEVWRAYDTATKRVVAIKVLPEHLARDGEFQRRFRREAEAAARISNPHIIPIHDYGEINGRLYVNMRLIEGRDLAEVLRRGPLEPGRAVRIIEQVASALHAAHRTGLVHRDVKPSNVLIDEDDFAYLIDFGIARALDETRLTSTGGLVGTMLYMAPERLGKDPAEDARADIYALACVLYECLTGEPPFDAANMAGLVLAHVNTPPPRPSVGRPAVPAEFDQIIRKGMAKDPNQRYVTTIELARAAHDAVITFVSDPMSATEIAPQRSAAGDSTSPPDQTLPAEKPLPPRGIMPTSAPTLPATPSVPLPSNSSVHGPTRRDPNALTLPDSTRRPEADASSPFTRSSTRRRAAIFTVLTFLGVVAVIFVSSAVVGNQRAPGPSPGADFDAPATVKQAADVMSKVTGMHVSLTVEGAVPNLAVTKLDGDVSSTPQTTATGTATLTVGRSNVDSKFVYVDNHLYSDVADPGKHFTDYGIGASICDVSTLLDPNRGLANILEHLQNPAVAGSEDINGVATNKITGKSNNDDVATLAGSRLNAADAPPTPTNVWIASDGSYQLVKIEFTPVQDGTMTMTMSEWGKEVTANRPPF
ncbi:LppX_LprAFG lipoprotein [Mycobacterium bourgelatii]|uniref:non-specific serine/threonine protein kinase n=1 Tax=Mycobacterium bourgelatii TaxID=1273442 RepID=A0A7I9YU25_MYCBU|nr:LppX_LprAFG lipoprotein [Mycobacterium bourgelatii]GFG92135.1 hypothetical protein MBOU_41770 [Mycobacterium bourgelatii]